VLIVKRGRRPKEMPFGAALTFDWNRNAPIERLSQEFIGAMRARGWLR